jgi:uncharacterized membrane-anchored protein YhcB (DUF1043 family)
MKEITFSLIEIFISLVVETIILGALFTWVSNKASVKSEQNLKSELKKVEDQNKFDFQQLQSEIRSAKSDIISQIKESELKK